MRILINGGHGLRLPPSPWLGGLVTYRNGIPPTFWAAKGLPWAMDNCRFTQPWQPWAFLLYARRAQAVPGCLWAAVPDVVADAAATDRAWHAWAWTLRAFGLPLAYVGQDGATVAGVPWDRMAALFIGGSTAWKLSAMAAQLITTAQDRGKRVHMGRVNTQKRLTYAASLGCTSIDGLSFSAFSRDKLRWGLPMVQVRQGRLWSIEEEISA